MSYVVVQAIDFALGGVECLASLGKLPFQGSAHSGLVCQIIARWVHRRNPVWRIAGHDPALQFA